MEKVIGFLTPAIIYLFIFILNAMMPGRWVVGYATKENSDEKLKYRLNGLLVLITVVAIWVALCYFKIIPWNWLYLYRC